MVSGLGLGPSFATATAEAAATTATATVAVTTEIHRRAPRSSGYLRATTPKAAFSLVLEKSRLAKSLRAMS